MLTPVQKQYIAIWRGDWIAERLHHSQHPRLFWEEVANTVMDGRLGLKNNYLVPVGRYAINWPGAMEMLVSRNNLAIGWEREGRLLEATFGYEASVADEFLGTHPYDRLRIIYTREQWWQDAIRICTAFLANARFSQPEKDRFQRHLGQAQPEMRPMPNRHALPITIAALALLLVTIACGSTPAVTPTPAPSTGLGSDRTVIALGNQP